MSVTMAAAMAKSGVQAGVVADTVFGAGGPILEFLESHLAWPTRFRIEPDAVRVKQVGHDDKERGLRTQRAERTARASSMPPI